MPERSAFPLQCAVTVEAPRIGGAAESNRSVRNQRVVEIPYAPDSARQYQHLAALPWFALLDSGRPRAPLGRYDIIVAQPRQYVRAASCS